MRCPRCGEDQIGYIGEAYDDEEHLGSAYECLECDYNFTIRDGGEDIEISAPGKSVLLD